MSLTASILSRVSIRQAVAGDIEAGQSQIDSTHSLKFEDGAGAGKADVQFTDRRTLAASADESLDLSGALESLMSAAVFKRVKYIEIRAAATNAGNIVVTRPASNGIPFVDAEAKIFPDIPPGGRASWGDPGATGVEVTSSSADLINIANADAVSPATYEIIVIGAKS